MTQSTYNLDVNASANVLPEVRTELIRILQSESDLGLNPSSIHSDGQVARALIEESRASIRRALNLSKGTRIIFTSGATEGNVQAHWMGFRRIQRAHRGEGAPVAVTSAVEHPSVLEPFREFAQVFDVSTHVLTPTDGCFDSIEKLSDTFPPNISFFSFALANNETGIVFPLAQYLQQVKERSPESLIHCDAVQALGKIKFNFEELGADIVTLSGHKIGGLTGSGLLLVRDGIEVTPLLYGGAQELRSRSGTENVLGVVALGIAVETVVNGLTQREESMLRAKDRLWEALKGSFPDIQSFTERHSVEGASFLPNTLNIRFPGILADDLVVALDLSGIRVSSGSACSSGKPLPSHVLLGFGYSQVEARESLRISLPPGLSDEEVDSLAEKIVAVVSSFR